MNFNTSSDEDGQQFSSQEIEQAKEYIKSLYRVKNGDFWKYTTTCFKSCVNMTPKVQIREALAESVPNQPIKSTIKYDDELFSESELKCMASCTNRLVLLENARTEFDSILEYTAKEGKQQRGLDYVLRKTSGKSQSNFLMESEMFSDKINKEIEASNQKQTEDFMQMITVLTNYCSSNCFNFKDINLLNTDEENDCISRCANISNRISNSVQNEIQLAAANPLMFSKNCAYCGAPNPPAPSIIPFAAENKLIGLFESVIRTLYISNYLLSKCKEIELNEKKILAEVESSKFENIIAAIGQDTLIDIANSGPELQAKLLNSLGLTGYLMTD